MVSKTRFNLSLSAGNRVDGRGVWARHIRIRLSEAAVTGADCTLPFAPERAAETSRLKSGVVFTTRGSRQEVRWGSREK